VLRPPEPLVARMLGITGPLAGMIATRLGYPAIFLGATLCCLAGSLLVIALKRRPAATVA